MSDPPNPWATPAASDPPNPWATPAQPNPSSPSTSPPSPTPSPPPSSSTSLSSEVSHLDTILFRFASTSDARFESTVARVLPNLLPLLTRQEAEVRDKVIEILQHINKRIKVLPELQLPVSELVMMYIDPLYNTSSSAGAAHSSTGSSSSPTSTFFFTFTLMFIEKGFARLDKREQSILAPHLLVHSSTHPLQQQTTILHIFLAALSAMQYEQLDDTQARDRWAFAHNPSDKQLVLSFLQDVLLYTPPHSKPPPPTTSLLPSPPLSSPADSAPSLPEGLSADAVALVTKGGSIAWSSDELSRVKVSVLAFLSALSHSNLAESSKFSVEEELFGASARSTAPPSLLSDTDIFPHALIASTIGSSDVSREAENLLRRMKQLQLHSPALLSSLFSLFLGSMDNARLPASARRAPAGINLRLKLLAWLSKSSASVHHSLALSLKALFDCWFGAVTNYRLRYSSLFFCSHFIKQATLPSLTSIGQVLVNALLRLLAILQTPAAPASPFPSTAAPSSAALTPIQSATLRGLVYHNLGLLSTRLPSLMTRNLKMLQLFFKALAEEKSDEVLSQVHEGLVYLRSAFVAGGDAERGQESLAELKSMLMRLCESGEKRVRLNALTCLNRLFDFSDVQCRWQCICSSNDGSIEMRDEANKGLLPFALKEARMLETKGRERAERERESRDRKEKADAEVKVNTAAVAMDVDEKKEAQFSGEEADGKESTSATSSGAIYSRMDPTVAADVPYPSFPSFMSHVSSQLSLTPVAAGAVRAPLQLDSAVFIHLMAFIAACFDDSAKQSKLTTAAFAASVASSSPSSLLSYQLLLELAFLSPLSDVQSSASVHLVSLVSSLPSFFAPLYLQRVDWLKKYLLGNSAESRSNTATLLTLLAPSFPSDTVATLLSQFTTILAASPSVSSSAFDALHGSTLAIGVLVAELRRRGGEVSKAEVDGVQLLVERLSAAAVAKDASLGAAACVSIGRIGKLARLPLLPEDDQHGEEKEQKEKVQASQEKKKLKGEAPPYGRNAVVRRLLDLTKGSDRKQERITEEAVKALGCLVQGDPSLELVQPILDGLLSLVTLKHEEVHFAVGETLAIIGDVERSPSATAVASPPTADSPLSSLPYLEKVLSFSLEQLSKGSQVARAASCTWLLCVIKFSTRLPASSYPSLQSRLTLALTDSNQFTQEAAAKALALLYEKTDSPALKEELVAALMRTFTSGAHKLSADTEVVLDSEKGEVSTMKELMTVANDMGQPDLVYRFMDIASHHSAWQSRMGSAFTLQSILGSSAAMKEKVVELLPKLYLYQFDPNPKIKDSMRQLWQSLIDHPKPMIDAHFHPIAVHLLRSMDSRQFRVRLAACLGLVDLIPHRSWSEVGAYLPQLWASLFRLLDDVNGETRKAAVSLSNALSQLSVRLCDPRYSAQKVEVQQAIDVLLPILLKEGITARAKEVQSISIKTLLSLIKHGGVFLRPHLAELLSTLLEGMSSMESSAFSYLQFHARSMQMSDEDLELARLSVAKNTPLADAVQSCLQVVDAQSLPSVVSRLTDILQQGIGLPTLTATGKFIISLVNSPVGGELKEHAGPLMSALVQGLNDQSTSVRRVFAAALGYLCRVAKRKRVGRVIEGLLAQYTSDDSASAKRLACGLAVQQLVEKASDSTREEFFPTIAPYAFLASHDGEDDVKKLWSAVWEDMVPSTDSGAVTYQADIVALTRTTFDSSSWTMRQTTYAALTTLVKASKARFEEHLSTFVPLVVKAMPGRIWAGKEKLFGLAVAVCVEVRDDAGSKVKEEDVQQLLHAVLEETKRNKTDHKREAIAAVGEIAQANAAFVDVTEEMKQTLDGVFQQATSHQGGASAREQAAATRVIGSDADVHDRKKAAKDDQLYFATAYTALGRIFPSPAFLSSQQQHVAWYLSSLTQALRSGLEWQVRVEALKALSVVLKQAGPGVLSRQPVTDVVDALVASSRDGKQSGVRAKSMEAVLTLLQRGDVEEVKTLLQSDLTARLREMLRERRDDPVAEVLTLSDAIKAKLDALAAASGSSR